MSAINVDNIAAKGFSFYTPAQLPAAGTAIVPQPNGREIPLLFKPLKIRGVEFQNRIFLSPLCQYSADNGHVTPWHQAHLGGIFTRGPGLTIIEATAVLPEGRITPQDTGLWIDSQIAPLKSIVDFAHSQSQKVGIQLGHAGRKASTIAPWLSGATVATEVVGGWPEGVYAPSAIQWAPEYAQPKEASVEYIKTVVGAFAASAKRAVEAGIDVIEIHSAHGYLLSSFLSPISNKRADDYGGSFENRTRLTLEIVDAIRAVIPEDTPLFLRISASDCLEEALPNEPSWKIEDTVRFAPILATHGVDFLDVSSAGNHPAQIIKGYDQYPYQAHFSAAVKQAVGDKLIVGAVGGIDTGKEAEGILRDGKADVAIVGRMFQKNPGLVTTYAEELGVEVFMAHQIEWGFKGRGKERSAYETKSSSL